MAHHNPMRYAGHRWTVLYGAYSGVEQYAVTELNRCVQRCMPYVVECVPASGPAPDENRHWILVGTASSNRLIAELVDTGEVRVPDHPQGYTIACMTSKQDPRRRLLVVAGREPTGVLYGVQDLYAHVVGPLLTGEESPDALRHNFDSLPDFCLSDYPRVEHRGIWTWGYVIYDYRAFIDNMARLKMNMLTVWNDCPPLNMDAILCHAHARGVQVVPGFAWGWGETLDLGSAADRRSIKESVLRKYESDYAHLDIDGLYFQTLTEHNATELDGKSVAALACEMVNDIAGELFARAPRLKIHFGLHATSILDRFHDLAELDPRVSIVWEDAGVLPYAYTPVIAVTKGPEGSAAFSLDTFEKTLDYSVQLASFRKGTGFALVPKGWTCLNWAGEFEHHGPFILGERDPDFIAARLKAAQPRWDTVNALWEEHAGLAARFYTELLRRGGAPMTATGLIEDGLFEALVQPSVAIFAETLWNPDRDPLQIRACAARMEHAANRHTRRYGTAAGTDLAHN